MAKNYRNTYLYLWILLAVGLAVVCAVSFVDEFHVAGLRLSKGTFRDVILAPEREQGVGEEEYVEDAYPPSAGQREVQAETDTTVRSVLIFGDSMTILVANRLAAYGEKNGYEVVSVTWDGSSSVSWAGCDTLDNFIERYHPDFVMVTLGSNELFLKNFEARRPYVEKVVAKLGGIPFVWIGPPNWKEDVGFNAMMRRALPRGTYYDSNGLDLPRGADHIHPTPSGGITWTDSIMSWMRFTPHPIPSERPDAQVRTRSHKTFYYKAGGGRSSQTLEPEAPEESSEISEPSVSSELLVLPESSDPIGHSESSEHPDEAEP